MADNIKFKIEGIEQVNKMLSTLPKELSDRVLLDINKQVGKIVQKELQQNAPEGNNDKSSKQKIEENVVVKKSDTKTGVLVGFTKKVWYVKLLELGTKVRRTLGKGKYKKRANRGRITRRPFIERSHLNAYPKAVDYFVNNYLKIVNRSLKRLAKRFK